ncbi:aldo/keto reductase [Planctomycetes bacterium K23_9]|uniref:General stress protein 69 n=1 Tax=Stieleria marina TaxID=1930275 RepID=A0A517NX83_9BACT|nr:General stress protein 69 [Planctomycetes bacterium K23_9]
MNQIPKRTLGRTGLSVTQLGYGSMGLRGPKTWGVRVVDDEASAQVLNAVLDAGINFIDTSPDYGIAEQRIGDAISSRRDEYYLATKCGCVYTQHDDHLEIDHVWDADVIERNLETSLTRLQTDSIDLLQFHGGDAVTLQQAGLIDLLRGFRDKGLIRFLGVSSKLPHLAGLIELDVFDTYQVPYSCLANEHGKWITTAGEQGAGVIVRGGIAHGGPDAEIDRPALRDVWTQAKLDEILPGDMSRSELILRHTLSQPYCHTTIVGTCNLEHLAENVRATIAGPLPDDFVAEIDRRVKGVG